MTCFGLITGDLEWFRVDYRWFYVDSGWFQVIPGWLDEFDNVEMILNWSWKLDMNDEECVKIYLDDDPIGQKMRISEIRKWDFGLWLMILISKMRWMKWLNEIG